MAGSFDSANASFPPVLAVTGLCDGGLPSRCTKTDCFKVGGLPQTQSSVKALLSQDWIRANE